MLRRTPHFAAMAVLTLILASCSAGASPSPSPSATPAPSPEMSMAGGDHMEEFTWGEPAKTSEATRVVEIRMLDELRFDPASVEVKVGETVTFKLVNAGKLEHDFTLGDQDMQDEHEAEMAGGMSAAGHEQPNVMTLKPGAEGEMTWHFTAPMTVLYGCHVTGHYSGGMVGTLTVVGS